MDEKEEEEEEDAKMEEEEEEDGMKRRFIEKTDDVSKAWIKEIHVQAGNEADNSFIDTWQLRQPCPSPRLPRSRQATSTSIRSPATTTAT